MMIQLKAIGLAVAMVLFASFVASVAGGLAGVVSLVAALALTLVWALLGRSKRRS